ncbi:MAG: hypothetical protein QOK05_1934 [Chloroflexota bacterium]|jgi:quinol monooxygenase YgiN|nr:hypothetical protein [Chloroflexota bacterium]
MVTAALDLRPDQLEEALRMSVEHVLRSRAEPGCISHDVYQDVQDANRVLFMERWADRAALEAHFAVPEAVAFSRAIGGMTTTRTRLEIHDVPDPD